VKQVIRLRDIAVQTDPVLVLPQINTDPRTVVVNEDINYNKQKSAERNAVALQHKKLQNEQKTIAQRKLDIAKALKLKKIPELTTTTHKLPGISRIRPYTIPKKDVSVPESGNKHSSGTSDLFGEFPDLPKPPTPGNSTAEQDERSEEDSILADD